MILDVPAEHAPVADPVIDRLEDLRRRCAELREEILLDDEDEDEDEEPVAAGMGE